MQINDSKLLNISSLTGGGVMPRLILLVAFVSYG